MVRTRLATPGAALRVVKTRERRQEVPAETGTLELGTARDVEPPVDARKVEAAAIHRLMTLDAGHPIRRTPLVTIATENSTPIGRERVATASAAANTRTDHVDASVRHPAVY